MIPHVNDSKTVRWVLPLVAAVVLSGVIHAGARAGDWPQFLGPTRDGVAAPDERVADHLPAGGPPVAWSKHVGQGFSGPVVAAGRLVVFHRDADHAVVDCLDAA